MSDPTTAPAVPQAVVEQLRESVDRGFERTVSDLRQLVSIPGIAWDSFDQAELRRSAEAVAELLRAEGFESVELLAADGRSAHPAVVAHRAPAAGRPTVLLYAHHDVQPPGDLSSWTSEPFRAQERDGRLYGRGAADDKAGVMAHIGAIRVLREVLGEDHGLGLTVFIEGEEEAGSPHFGDFLARHRDRLAADAIVIADSSNWEVGKPSLTTSLRGVVGAVVEVRGASHAVHSGMFGGPLLDAPTLLARLIATLHDDDGAVAVAGLERTETPEGQGEPEYAETQFRADAGIVDSLRLAGRGSVASRLWEQPALSVTGIDATAVDVASNTIAPAARAKISMRIAPGQDPAAAGRALERHLLEHAPFGAQVSVSVEETGPAFRTDTAAPAAAAMLWALGEAWGTEPLEIGGGGSIPFTADLQREFPQATLLVTGVEDPDTRAHGIDESLHLGDFRHAVLAEALWLASLAAQD